MRQNSVEITVAERKLKVACPQGQESALLFAAAEVNQRLDKINKSNNTAITSPEQSLLMAALNLANELAMVKKQIEQERKENESKIKLLQASFEHALITPNDKQA